MTPFAIQRIFRPHLPPLRGVEPRADRRRWDAQQAPPGSHGGGPASTAARRLPGVSTLAARLILPWIRPRTGAGRVFRSAYGRVPRFLVAVMSWGWVFFGGESFACVSWSGGGGSGAAPWRALDARFPLCPAPIARGSVPPQLALRATCGATPPSATGRVASVLSVCRVCRSSCIFH